MHNLITKQTTVHGQTFQMYSRDGITWSSNPGDLEAFELRQQRNKQTTQERFRTVHCELLDLTKHQKRLKLKHSRKFMRAARSITRVMEGVCLQ